MRPAKRVVSSDLAVPFPQRSVVRLSTALNTVKNSEWAALFWHQAEGWITVNVCLLCSPPFDNAESQKVGCFDQ